MENCGKTNLPYGTRVLVKTKFDFDVEEFTNVTGTAVHPFSKGCKEKDWVGVILDKETLWGKKFNFHITELIIE